MNETEGVALDLRTLVLVYLIADLITVVALGSLWIRYRGRFPGLGLWLANTVLQTLTMTGLLLRGAFPDPLIMVASNLAAQTGVVLVYWGLQLFVRRSPSWAIDGTFLGLFAIGFSWFAVSTPNLTARDLLISAGLAFSMGQVAWLLLVRVKGELRSAARQLGVVALAFALVNLVRITNLLNAPHPGNDFYQESDGEALYLLVYLILTLLFLVAQMLLVTRRLLVDVGLQEVKFSKAFHASPYAMLLTRATDGQVIEVNDGFVEMTGYLPSDVLGKTTTELRIWDSEEARQDFVGRLRNQGKVRNLELPFRRKSGEPLMGLVSAEALEFGGEACLMACMGDITEQHRLRAQLQDAATHDALTGLPNRRLFADRFEVARSNAERTKTKLAVMSLDLDHFKTINDTWGHEVGDRVLVEASQRLASCLRRVDTVARFGGDEFVLLLWEVEAPGDASQIALKILERFRLPIEWEGHSLILHASIGLALYPDDGETLEVLLKKSDDALYGVKEHGRNHYRFTPATKPTS